MFLSIVYCKMFFGFGNLEVLGVFSIRKVKRSVVLEVRM